MANEVIGLGTAFSGSTLGAVTGLRDVTGPEPTVEDIDISSNDDATGSFMRRFRASMTDPGEVTLNFVFQPATYTAFLAAIRVDDTFTTTLENSSTCVFDGYVKGVAMAAPWEDVATIDVTIKVSGLPVYSG